MNKSSLKILKNFNEKIFKVKASKDKSLEHSFKWKISKTNGRLRSLSVFSSGRNSKNKGKEPIRIGTNITFHKSIGPLGSTSKLQILGPLGRTSKILDHDWNPHFVMTTSKHVLYSFFLQKKKKKNQKQKKAACMNYI